MLLPFPTNAALQPSLKILCLILAALSHVVGFKAPNPPPPKETVYKGQPFEKVVRILASASQVSVTACFLSECAVFLSMYQPTAYSQHLVTSLCPGSSPSMSTLATITPSFLLGLSIMLISSALRVWCYVTLGTFFTFEVAFQSAHKLVTSGPYRYVRHPSYTAVLLMLVGAAMTCFASGSYINECHIMNTPGRWWVRLWFTLATFATFSLWKRGRVEDDGLRKHFGETWERYRQEVPWMFIPGIY